MSTTPQEQEQDWPLYNTLEVGLGHQGSKSNEERIECLQMVADNIAEMLYDLRQEEDFISGEEQLGRDLLFALQNWATAQINGKTGTKIEVWSNADSRGQHYYEVEFSGYRFEVIEWGKVDETENHSVEPAVVVETGIDVAPDA